MARLDKRNKRKNGITTIILIIIPTLILIANFLVIKENKTIEKNITLKNNQLKEIKNKYNSKNEESLKIEEEINIIKDIDNFTIKKQEEYYQLLKTFEDKVSKKEIDYKIAYLTFDDGPYNLTHEFLKVLEDNNIGATFFTIGLDKDTCFDNPSKSCKEVYKKIASNGHTIANHTYSHLIFNGLYSSTNSFMNNVKKQEDLIKSRTGVTTNIVRFPGGSASAGSLKDSIIKELRKSGYGWVDWTALNGDGGYIPDKQTAFNTFKKSIDSDIEVVLFHDYNSITLSMLPDVIKYLQKEKYVLLPLFYESKMVNK